MKKDGLVAYPLFGAKNRASIRERIISLFPEGYDQMHYLEPCFGSGAVFLNKRPSRIETINDLDLDTINFLETLRKYPDELIRSLALTPWSRSEFEKSNQAHDYLSDLEQARLFYIRVRQSFVGSPRLNGSGWRRCVDSSARAGMPQSWKSGIDHLYGVAERLLDAQIENRDALELIQDCDSANTLVYFDPPYIFETREMSRMTYAHEMDSEWHKALAKLLLGMKSKIILSGYRHGIYKRLEQNGWNRIDIDTTASSSIKRTSRVESLWLNYTTETKQTKIEWGTAI